MVAERLAGRVVVVTGAGRGIGRTLAVACAAEGALVAAVARTTEDLRDTTQAIERQGGKAMAVPADVTDAAAMAGMVSTVTETFGHLDVLINNAGILRSGRITDMAAHDFAAVVNVNVVGTFLATQAVIPTMRDQGGGKIVNMASSWATKPVPQHAAYCASKAAIVQFTRVAALELAPFNIQVNAVAPGYIATEMNTAALADPVLGEKILGRIPAGRVADPAELAPLVVFLASPEADYITGEVITFDGGFGLR